MKLKNVPSEAIEQIEKLSKQGVSSRNIASKVNEILALSLTKDNVLDIINKLQEEAGDTRTSIQKLSDEMEETTNFKIANDHYIFYKKAKTEEGADIVEEYPIKISEVDAIFKDYSKHGGNLSGDEILQKYQIKPQMFNLIKSRLRLFKTSHIVSPYTLDNLSEEELQEYIDDGIDYHIRDRYKEKFTKTYDKRVREDYVKKSKVLASYDNFLEHIQKYLSSYSNPSIKTVPVSQEYNKNEITVVFSDLHIGKMNNEDVFRRIEEMGNDIILRSESKVNLICLGDLVETLAKGGMHNGQIESMDGEFGFDLLMKAVSSIEQLIYKIYSSGKKVEFYGISGNHDRFTKNYEDSYSDLCATVIYELVSRGIKEINVRVNAIRDKWHGVDVDDFRLILNHGYKSDSKKNASEILWELGAKDKHNIILQGDKHHTEVIDNHANATRIIVPSLAGANEYDKSLLLSSYPGYIVIQKGRDNLPNTSIIRLK